MEVVGGGGLVEAEAVVNLQDEKEKGGTKMAKKRTKKAMQRAMNKARRAKKKKKR